MKLDARYDLLCIIIICTQPGFIIYAENFVNSLVAKVEQQLITFVVEASAILTYVIQ